MEDIIGLELLAGKHLLSGVDFGKCKSNNYDNDESTTISFVLNGKTYTAIENPDDSYRSSMKEIKVSDNKIKNIFPSIMVTGIIGESPDDNEIIRFYDIENGKLVLSVGTDTSDNYYPSFVNEFIPENMHTNSGFKKKRG